MNNNVLEKRVIDFQLPNGCMGMDKELLDYFNDPWGPIHIKQSQTIIDT
jgi:hypothetical protein